MFRTVPLSIIRSFSL